MQWFELSSIAIIVLLAAFSFSLMQQNAKLKEENIRLLKMTDEYEVIRDEAKELLKTENDIKTIKSLREKYNLSLVDAKNVVDSVK